MHLLFYKHSFFQDLTIQKVSIPSTINNTRFEKSKVDFGASINVMRYSIYAFLNFDSLKKTDVVV
jgi:hypothetical protein